MRKTALITGASEGIGYELAKIFAQDGYNLVIVARREEKLNEIKSELESRYGIEVMVIVEDLSVSTAPERVYSRVKGLRIDALVNNAGFGNFGEFVYTDWNREYRMIELNIAALVNLTKLFLKDMVERGDGKIMNVASTAAFEAGPLMAVYYASKAFVLSFSEAIAREVKGRGVVVSVLCPGPTQTGFEQAAELIKSKLFRQFKAASAQAVAAYGYKAMQKGKVVAVYGLFNKLLVFSTRLLPRAVLRDAIYRLQGKID